MINSSLSAEDQCLTSKTDLAEKRKILPVFCSLPSSRDRMRPPTEGLLLLLSLLIQMLISLHYPHTRTLRIIFSLLSWHPVAQSGWCIKLTQMLSELDWKEGRRHRTGMEHGRMGPAILLWRPCSSLCPASSDFLRQGLSTALWMITICDLSWHSRWVMSLSLSISNDKVSISENKMIYVGAKEKARVAGKMRPN